MSALSELPQPQPAFIRTYDKGGEGLMPWADPASLTDSSATPGASGHTTVRGRFAISASQSGITVSNSLVTAKSIVLVIQETADATFAVKSVVPAAGQFVLTGTASSTGITKFSYIVLG